MAKRDELAKARKLIEALAEPCAQGDEHAWRRCRRCLAVAELDCASGRRLFKLYADRSAHEHAALEKIARMVCSREMYPGEPNPRGADCQCFSCTARKALAGEPFLDRGAARAEKLVPTTALGTDRNRADYGRKCANPRCCPVYGSCALEEGHAGNHSQDGPYRGQPAPRPDPEM